MKLVSFRRLLFPLSWIYGLITYFRNKLFDWKIFPTYQIPVKSICVGNLSVGGTGKTPHVSYLAGLLKNSHSIAILSRGYGRSTKGFHLAHLKSKATEIGDEPLSYVNQFSNTFPVAVCESRKNGIIELLKTKKIDLILLDDAFQHRKVKAGLTILLTQYGSPYFEDTMLPSGNLREYPSGEKRADLLIVTKCPKELTKSEKDNFIKKTTFDEKKIFFSFYNYGNFISFDRNKYAEKFENIVLVTGIANPDPLVEFLSSSYEVSQFTFRDHHTYNLDDIQKIHAKFDILPSRNKCILTTEKDFMRLKENIETFALLNYPWFYVPIQVEINNSESFNKYILDYVEPI
jgi:tetraacyldisaccharide 4'-kinase